MATAYVLLFHPSRSGGGRADLETDTDKQRIKPQPWLKPVVSGGPCARIHCSSGADRTFPEAGA
jgi:hypothetical protein